MAPISLNNPQSLVIEFSQAGATETQAYFSFGFAPEQPALGEPGKNTGDILLIKNGASNMVQVSLGTKTKCTTETFRKAGGLAGKWLMANPVATIRLSADVIRVYEISDALQAFLEGLRLGSYQYNSYKKVDQPVSITVQVADEGKPDETQVLINRVMVITDAVLLAREWAHEPANVINPVSLAESVEIIAEQAGLKCLILDDQDLEALKAGAILAVGRGSKNPPRMIILEYSHNDVPPGAKPVVLVGKAITFDTGGYSLKGVENIQGMKYDKCGGISVLSILYAASQLHINTPLIGVIAAAENMVSSDAYRPDDIITSLSGKTIEIISTDAEGRLVLADALTYTQRIFQPRAIIDIATLTGGVVTALGRVRAGIMGNNQELIDSLIRAGDETMERLWQLPLDDDYFPQTKGEDADLKNSGGREGQSIMGGIFLKQFVDNAIPWAHLDIAGVADMPKDGPYQPKGATGFGVRLLLKYLEKAT